MNILTVIPLTHAKGVPPELSYFTAADVPVGAIVSVPLRSKSIHAIVTRTESAEDQKLGIKNAPFAIRKLGRVKATAFFPPIFIETSRQLASYYAGTLGSVIGALMSDSILENTSKLVPPLPSQASFGMTDAVKPGDAKPRAIESERVYAIQGDDADRMSSWRSLIRQEFARKKSIAIYVPSVEDCRSIYSELEKGIEGYIYMLHGSLTPKKAVETWTKIADTDHPVVVVATGSFSLLPRGDVSTVIIEREGGRGWIMQKSPYLDMRRAIESVARNMNQIVFIADSMLRAETLHRLDSGDLEQGSPFKWRSISDAKDSLIDMKAYKAVENRFKVISPELEKLIQDNREQSTHLFILSSRRGHSTVTVCDDCETVVLCRNCSAPVVLHTSQETGKNFFMCHKCGERRSADETCTVCGGWRLTPLGIGVDRVHEEIGARFPGAEVFRVDADTTTTEKQVAEALQKWRERPGSILLGTEMALLHLSGKVDHTAVVSMDSLFALPDFRINEKVMYTLARLRALSTRSILVQTRKPEEKVFEYALKGNLSDFYRALAAERKQFAYPPFSVLVKLTIEGKKDAIALAMSEAEKALTPQELDIFPAFTATVRGNSVIHGLMKIEPHAWPDPDLVAKLRSLPTSISIKVNPDSLL